MSSIVQGVQTTLSENLGGSAQAAAPDNTKFSLDDVPDLTGKVAVVTGGSEGIGYGCTYTLLSKNISKLYILSLSQEVVDGASKAVVEELGEQKAQRIKWLQCDLSDWHRVVKVAKEISDSTDRLDILINNAARGIRYITLKRTLAPEPMLTRSKYVLFRPELLVVVPRYSSAVDWGIPLTYQLTDYGIDRHMAVNHFGHVILTSHLLPLLKKTASQGNTVRISNQASNAHQSSPKDTKFKSIDDLNTDLGPMGQYGRSKLAAILYSRYLNRHLTKEFPNILANATHPGVVDTAMSERDIHEPYPLAGYLMSTAMKPFKKDQFEGALSMMYASTVTEKSGEYICPPAASEPGSELAQDEKLGEDMMKLTREVITEKTRKESVDKGCPMKDY